MALFTEGTAMLLSAAIAERKASELRAIDSAETLRDREEMRCLAQGAGGVATFEWDFGHFQVALAVMTAECGGGNCASAINGSPL